MSVHYVPAALESYSQLARTFYSKPETNDKEYSMLSRNDKEFHLKDKCIRFTASKYGNTPLIDESYDRTMAAMGPSFLASLGIKIALINHNSGKPINYNPLKDCGILSILDSGGFQMFSGMRDFIDPAKLARDYNRYANLGMDLDIPVYMSDNLDTLKANALIQKANYDLIKTILKPKVKMALVSHGDSVEDREKFYEWVDRDNPEYVSIAGLARQVVTPYGEMYNAEAVAHTLSIYPKLKYLHCLGATSNDSYIVYSLFHHLGLVDAIGADSTAYMYNGATGIFDLVPRKQIHIPNNSHLYHPLPCNCAICSILNDSRVINSNFPLVSHSLALKKYRVDTTSRITPELLAGNVTPKEYLTICGSKMSSVRLRKLVNYVQEFKASGVFKKAEYPVNVQSKGLFEVKGDYSTYYSWLSTIKKYEKYYGKEFYKEKV
jgi:hypothetical protein